MLSFDLNKCIRALFTTTSYETTVTLFSVFCRTETNIRASRHISFSGKNRAGRAHIREGYYRNAILPKLNKIPSLNKDI